jgi:uncharacterized membrane protein
MSDTRSEDQAIEVTIGNLLRAGVILAASLVAAGAFVYLLRHGHEVIDYDTFHGEPESLKSLTAIIHGALHLSGRAMIQLGLLVLIATPIARVLFSAVAFFHERDYLYVFLTLLVLAILLYSLFGPGV